MLIRTGLATTLLAAAGFMNLAGAQDTGLDLVISGGRVLDPETGLDAVRDVGIRDGRIVAVSEAPLVGREVFDANGLAVAPGFVDLHSHAVNTLFGSRMQVLDGVTTQLELENGVLPVDAWYERMAAEGRPAHYGATASWTYARIASMTGVPPEPTIAYYLRAQGNTHWMRDPAEPAQREQIVAYLAQGLEQGALGVGVNAGYAPGYDIREMKAVHQLAARYDGRPVVYHLRHMGLGADKSAYSAIVEVLGLTAVTGGTAHVCHINSSSGVDVANTLALLREARGHGVRVTTEAYPYGAGSTVIGADFLRDPDFPARLGHGPEAIVYLPTGERVASMERLHELQAADPGGLILRHFLDLSDPARKRLLDEVLVDPMVIVASDAMPWLGGRRFLQGEWPPPPGAMAHPRSAGTFSRFLRTYVREEGRLTLLQAVRKMTLDPALALEAASPDFRRKGRLQPGADADIVVFDPARIADRATYEQPAVGSAGFALVLVAGTAVVRDDVLVPDLLPGRPLRGFQP